MSTISKRNKLMKELYKYMNKTSPKPLIEMSPDIITLLTMFKRLMNSLSLTSLISWKMYPDTWEQTIDSLNTGIV
jgi:hypothetical protein